MTEKPQAAFDKDENKDLIDSALAGFPIIKKERLFNIFFKSVNQHTGLVHTPYHGTVDYIICGAGITDPSQQQIVRNEIWKTLENALNLAEVPADQAIEQMAKSVSEVESDFYYGFARKVIDYRQEMLWQAEKDIRERKNELREGVNELSRELKRLERELAEKKAKYPWFKSK